MTSHTPKKLKPKLLTHFEILKVLSIALEVFWGSKFGQKNQQMLVVAALTKGQMKFEISFSDLYVDSRISQ